jgi:hypothetical protein
MKLLLLLLSLFTSAFTIQAQTLDSLYEKGQYQRIIELYKTSGRSFSDQELPTIAAAYDRLGKLEEEEKVLEIIVSTYDPMITSDIPANYPYYSNFIRAGRMEKYKKTITGQYVRSVKDTALARRIISTLFKDQAPRQKFEDNKYSKEKGLPIRWDEKSVLEEWKKVDSSTTLFISQTIKSNNGFPPKAAIGFLGIQSMLVLMQHLDNHIRDQYDQILIDAACRKDLDMSDYAFYKTMTLARTNQIPGNAFQQTLDSLSQLKCK